VDTLAFIIRIIEILASLAWPLIVGFVIWWFRLELKLLIGRIEKLKWKEGEAVFTKDLALLPLKPAPALPDEVQDNTKKNANVPGVLLEANTLLEIHEAEAAPQYAIEKAWKQVDSALQRALKKKGLGLSSPDMARGNVIQGRKETLMAIGLSETDYLIFVELESLYRKTIHYPGHVRITTDDALRYRDYAKVIARTFEKTAEN
jgi:hypothetical protein